MIEFELVNMYNKDTVIGTLGEKADGLTPLRSVIFGTNTTPINGAYVTIKDLTGNSKTVALSADGGSYIVAGKKIISTRTYKPLEFKLTDTVTADEILNMSYVFGEERSTLFNKLVADKVQDNIDMIQRSIEAMICQQISAVDINYWYSTDGGASVSIFTVDWDITAGAPISAITGAWGGSTIEIDDVIADLDLMSDGLDKAGYIGEKYCLAPSNTYSTIRKMVSSLPNDARIEAKNHPGYIELDEYKIYKAKGAYWDLNAKDSVAKMPTGSFAMLARDAMSKMFFCSVANFKANFTNDPIWFDVPKDGLKGDVIPIYMHSRPLPFIDPAAKVYTANVLT